MDYDDWKIIADKSPQGYVELNDGEKVIYGPVESLRVDNEGWIELKVKWAIKRRLNEYAAPVDEKWEVVSNTPIILARFLNFAVSYQIEDTGERGQRVQFGMNVIYINNIQKVDPREVEGLHIATE